MENTENCYCGHSKSFEHCCDLYISQRQRPPSAEALMRSRYSAFCLKNMEHLLKTTHSKHRPGLDLEAQKQWAARAEFFKLEIVKTSQFGDLAVVEFKAHYKMKDAAYVHHEVSNFKKHAGLWFYTTGKIKDSP